MIMCQDKSKTEVVEGKNLQGVEEVSKVTKIHGRILFYLGSKMKKNMTSMNLLIVTVMHRQRTETDQLESQLKAL